MSYALLWIETLAIWLLWIAAVTASLGRVRSRARRILWGIAALLLPLLILGGFAAWAIAMPIVATKELHTHLEHNWSTYAISLLASFLIGTWMIKRASRRREPGLAPQAANWPRGKLWLALAATILVANMTLWNMDLAARSQALVLRIQMDSEIEALTPGVPDNQNAALLYEKAFGRLMGDDSAANALGGDYDPKDPATIVMFKRHEQTLKLLRQAAAMPLCRFDRDYLRPDLDLLMAETDSFHEGARLLAFDARRQVAQGNVDLAMQDVRSIFAMSRHVAGDPMTISVLTAYGIDALGDNTLSWCLPAVTRSSQLDALNLDGAWARRALRRALMTEQSFGTAQMGDWIDNGFGRPSPTGGSSPGFERRVIHIGDDPFTMLASVFWLSDEFNAYRDMIAQYRSMSLQPIYEIEPRLVETQQLSGGLFSSILVGSLSRTMDTAGRIEAMDDSAAVGVALARYRLDHGKMPGQLSDLVPTYLDEIPDDPFNGKPLQLAVKDGDWFIFSIEKMGDSNNAENVGFHFHPR
jgi:hypothetical protein